MRRISIGEAETKTKAFAIVVRQVGLKGPKNRSKCPSWKLYIPVVST